MHRVPYFTDNEGNVVIFRKVSGVVGFTHKVIVNGQTGGWLATGNRPSARHALYFLERARREGFAEGKVYE